MAGTPNLIVTTNDSLIYKQENVEKTEAIKNVSASDHTQINEKEDKKEGFINNTEEQEEKETEIDLGIAVCKLNLGPKKKLLVLPISGLLVHRSHCSRPIAVPKNRRHDFRSGNFMIYKRPFCEEFLRFCFERFEVGIWSSAMEHNIDGVLNNVFGELKSKILFTWDQSQCTTTDFMCMDNTKKPVFLKELSKLWGKKYTRLLPWRYGEYSSSNTLLITDPVKALVNPPNTSIFLGSYDPENKQDDFLGPNGELRVFLEGLAEAKDVQTYVKAHPIGEPAISSSHPDWDYYSKIVRLYGMKEVKNQAITRVN